MRKMNFVVNEILSSVLKSEMQINKRVEKSGNEVDLVIQHQTAVVMVKILNIDKIKEKKILNFIENNSILLDCNLSFIYPSKTFQLSHCMIILRMCYKRDLEAVIQSKPISRSDMCSVISRICNILIVLSEYDVMISNLSSYNIIYEDSNDIKLCDLFLDKLRKEEDLRIYDLCYKSPEELRGLECNDRSVIWSIGCILYEMINKKLPFNEDNNINRTKENILRCNYSLDMECDDMMKEMIDRMLKVENEERMSLKELRKEMIKINEILRDDKNNMMICKERKEILFNNDNAIVKLPIECPAECYLQNEKWKEIRDNLYQSYNNQCNEKILSILLMIKLYKEYYNINSELKYQINHICKEGKDSYLDHMIMNINNDYNDKDVIMINSKCNCFCEEGINFLFRMLKLINPTKLMFYRIKDMWVCGSYVNCGLNIPLNNQSLFGSYFSQLSDLQQLDLYKCNLTARFIESFIQSIPFMKLKYVILTYNPICPKGFRLLLPYLHLLINSKNELYLYEMNLNDESMILLSEELYKYPKLDFIDITENKNIHSKGLKALFSKFPISKIEFDFNRNKELLIDKNIPELIKYIKNKHYIRFNCYYELKVYNLEIDDDFFKSFISLRSNELRVIEWLDLSYNNLTCESVKTLIINFSSLPNLKEIKLYGNEIGDEGMKILSPHLHLLLDVYYRNIINCSKMGLSSVGLKYIVDDLKNNNELLLKLDVSDNKINSDGINYLIDYEKDDVKDFRIIFHGNPIGNIRFKYIFNNYNMLTYYNYNDRQYELNLSCISIDDESLELLKNRIDSIEKCKRIILSGNDISFDGLKSICLKSLESKYYPFIQMEYLLWRNEELTFYIDYCLKKKNSYYVNFSNLNINDSHISLIKQRIFLELDVSNNKITSKGLKELAESLHKKAKYISICNNPIGDEGVEIICKYFDSFTHHNSSLNLSNVGMTENGLKTLIERLKNNKLLEKINISGNELSEEELRLIIENKEVFDCLDELLIIVKDNIEKNELQQFLKTFSTVGTIKLNGVYEKE